MRTPSRTAALAAVLLTAALTAAPADAATKSCGTVTGTLSEVYKVTVSPTSISCSTARSLLNAYRATTERRAQDGKIEPKNGILVRGYRCRQPDAQIAGGYVTTKWICKKGSRSIVGTSRREYYG